MQNIFWTPYAWTLILERSNWWFLQFHSKYCQRIALLLYYIYYQVSLEQQKFIILLWDSESNIMVIMTTLMQCIRKKMPSWFLFNLFYLGIAVTLSADKRLELIFYAVGGLNTISWLEQNWLQDFFLIKLKQERNGFRFPVRNNLQ